MAKSKAKPTKIIKTFIEEINSVSHSPRFQVIVTNGVLELLVNTFVEHTCKHGKTIMERARDYPYSVKLVLLHEKGLINDFFFQRLDILRKIRNAAAHEAQFQLTPEMLLPFKGQMDSTKKHDFGEPKNFPFLCGETVMRFWNWGVQLFAPIFEPHLWEKDKIPAPNFTPRPLFEILQNIKGNNSPNSPTNPV